MLISVDDASCNGRTMSQLHCAWSRQNCAERSAQEREGKMHSKLEARLIMQVVKLLCARFSMVSCRWPQKKTLTVAELRRSAIPLHHL